MLAVVGRRARDRRRLVDLLGPPGEGAAVVGDPRAQVLLRRALRRALLLADGRARARARTGFVEGPVDRRLDHGRRRRGAPGRRLRTRSLQTGLVRLYAFAIAAGLAVLVLVFVAVEMNAHGWITTTLILAPARRGAADLAHPDAARLDRADRARWSRCSRSASGSRRSASFDFDRGGLQESSHADVVDGPRRLVPRRHVRGLLALARRADDRRRSRPRSPTAAGSAATGRAPTTG